VFVTNFSSIFFSTPKIKKNGVKKNVKKEFIFLAIIYLMQKKAIKNFIA